MSEKILFVDDDPNILNAFHRQLRKKFHLETASSGRKGLDMIEKKGPFSVVLADMRMPEMDGIAFLKKVREVTPDSVRLMLTGNADQQTAIDAVNEGNVFRFMTKPCPLESLINTIEQALSQYRLVRAERELLEDTLNGSVKLLMEILSIAAPTLSGRAIALGNIASKVAETLQIPNVWELQMAAMLSHIAYVTLPPETLAKARSGEALSETEQLICDHLPETGHKLLTNIPRLKGVARMVLYQNKNFDGSGVPHDSVAGQEIPMESRVLKVLHDLRDLEESKRLSTAAALSRMHGNNSRYDLRILQTVAKCLLEVGDDTGISSPLDVFVSELRPGQILVSNVLTEDGSVLVTAGHELSAAIVARLVNYHKVHKLKQPIQVTVPTDSVR